VCQLVYDLNREEYLHIFGRYCRAHTSMAMIIKEKQIGFTQDFLDRIRPDLDPSSSVIKKFDKYEGKYSQHGLKYVALVSGAFVEKVHKRLDNTYQISFSMPPSIKSIKANTDFYLNTGNFIEDRIASQDGILTNPLTNEETFACLYEGHEGTTNIHQVMFGKKRISANHLSITSKDVKKELGDVTVVYYNILVYVELGKENGKIEHMAGLLYSF
jgi:hypothetical protein